MPRYFRGIRFKIITNHARVAQRWSTTLPRWGPRVRSPSRALLRDSGNVENSMFLLFYFARKFGDKWGQVGARSFLSRFSSNTMMFSASFDSESPGVLPELNAFVSAS